MSEPVTFPAPVLDLVSPPRDKWEREERAFHALLPQLLQTHRGQYVAVHEGQAVESGEDKMATLMRAYGRFGYVPIYIGLVTDQPRPPDRIPRFSGVKY